MVLNLIARGLGYIPTAEAAKALKAAKAESFAAGKARGETGPIPTIFFLLATWVVFNLVARAGSRQRVESESKSSESSLPDEGEATAKLTCKICWDAETTMMFRPCNHLCVCKECADTVLDLTARERKCPICRKKIRSAERVYSG